MNDKKQEITKLHKTRIISAAEQLFAKNSYENVTMDDIAKAADYSKRTVYAYFENKEQIYHNVILKSMTMLKSTIQQPLIDEKDFITQYYAICNSLVDYYENYPLSFFGSLRFIAISKSIQEISGILTDIFAEGEKINELMLKLITKGISEGVVRVDIMPIPTIFLLWSSIASIIEFSESKKDYIMESTQLNKSEFLNYCFESLLKAIIN